MSSKYPGGIISKTAPTPSGPYADSTAPGIWTLEQQAALAKQGNWPTAGNVNPNLFIENLFSTYVYTGTGANQVITNGINLSTYGGLVWAKNRGTATSNVLIDTVRGGTEILQSNTADANVTVSPAYLTAQTTGYQTGPADSSWNGSGQSLVSWTFREQAKFFDIVTYTGNGATNQTIPHNLGSTPGCIIVKSTTDVNGWYVYHRGLTTPNNYNVYLSATAAQVNQSSNVWDVTSTTFQANQPNLDSNKSGQNYVAYLFAHDAGGFGLTGTDNVISCGNATVSGNATSVTLGYEPQWVMMKRISGVSDWFIVDNMRGFSSTASPFLRANTTGAEGANTGTQANATGFTSSGVFDNGTYIYIAVRRGPMAVPTLGTSVFTSVAQNLNSSATTVTTGFPVDLNISASRTRSVSSLTFAFDRLRGLPLLATNSTAAESTPAGSITFASNTSVRDSFWGADQGASGQTGIYWNWRRAPSFFDVVCYTNNASGASVQVNTHNLGVLPELAITKVRNDVNSWYVASNIGSTTFDRSFLDTTAASVNVDYVSASTYKGFTSTTFTVGSSSIVGAGGFNVVTYLFATCAGVSKVGSYTGTGAAQTINCGFTSGARFVLIKRTDSTGDWNVWDSARGIIPANDPYLALNSTAAEVTGTDYIDTTSVGFDVTSTAPAEINASGGTFIFLAIA
jgi:hypothetical protein